MTLGELIERLELEPPDKAVRKGFRLGVPTTVADMLAHARSRIAAGHPEYFAENFAENMRERDLQIMLGRFTADEVDALVDHMIANGHLPALAVAVDRAQHGGLSADVYRDPRDVAFVEYVASAMEFLAEENPTDTDRLGWRSQFRELAKAAKKRRDEVKHG